MTAPACIVLAGGLGTRLRSVLPDLPKCLAPVRGRPFLAWQLESLKARGVGRFVLSLGHLSEQVEAAAAGWTFAGAIECVREPRPLGTGGAIAFAMAAAQLDEALVVNGDTFLGGDLAALLAPLDAARGEQVRMAVVDVPDRTRFGGIEADAGGRVLRFAEKGRGDAGPINAGLYRIRREAFAGIDREVFSFETDVLPRLAAEGRVRAAAVAGPFIDIGVPEDYRRFCDHDDEFA